MKGMIGAASLIAATLAIGGCKGGDKPAEKPPEKSPAAAASGAAGAPAAKTPEGEAPKAEIAKAEIAKDEPAGEAVPTTKVGLETGGKALGGEAVKLDKAKFVGAGYEGEYNEALDSWTYEKWIPNADGGNDNVVRIYLDGFNDERPADVEAFATKLQEADFIDYGSKWPKIDKKEAFDGGWAITGETNDGEDTEKAFAVRLDKYNALCRGYVKVDAKDQDALLEEGVASCKTVTLP